MASLSRRAERAQKGKEFFKISQINQNAVLKLLSFKSVNKELYLQLQHIIMPTALDSEVVCRRDLVTHTANKARCMSLKYMLHHLKPF